MYQTTFRLPHQRISLVVKEIKGMSSSYDAPSVPLRKELGWLSIKEKEMIVKETPTMMYKSLNDLAPQYLSDLFV